MSFRILALLSVVWSLPTLLAAAERPNVVWIVSEDNSIHYLDHFFKGGAAAPNIEALAANGLTFDHAFSNAPVCSVARTTLATGCYGPRIATQYHRRYRVAPMPPGLRMFPAYLRDAGYYTTNNRKKDYNAVEGPGVWDESSGNASWRNRTRPDQPFFHMQSHAESHESSLHFGRDVFEKEETGTDPASVRLADYHPDTAIFRYTHARYLDRMKTIDEIVGRTVAQLADDGLLEDTFVFYFGDHGGVLPRGKGYPYESGLHVPLVVRVPENFQHLVPAKRAARLDGFVSFVDFGPTTLHLCGVSVPQQVDGKPFLGAGVSLDDLNARDEAFGYADRFDEKYDLIRSLRKGRFQYLRNYQPYLPDALNNNYRYKSLAFQEWRALFRAGRLQGAARQFFQSRPVEQLFDCEADPHQVRNLADDPQYAETLLTLRGRLQALLKELPDLSFYPESYLVAHAFDNPVRFGQDNQDQIGQLIDTADLALLPFEEAAPRIRQALASEEPLVRYWAAMVCTAFGNEAETLADDVRPLAKDPSAVVRLRAAEFLGRIGAVNPQPALTDIVNTTEDPIVATEALNSVVWFRDFFDDRYPVERSDFHPVSRGADIDDRLNYINGVPYPPKKPNPGRAKQGRAKQGQAKKRQAKKRQAKPEQVKPEQAKQERQESSATKTAAAAAGQVFGPRFPNLESMATGEWWRVKPNPRRSMNLNVARDQVVAFALYTHDHGTLKLTAQLFPLMPDEDRMVHLDLRDRDGTWREVAAEKLIELGWSAHFRIEPWDNTRDVAYRVRHGQRARFEGLIRRDPIDKDVIVVGNLSCNSSRTPGPRPKMVENLLRLDPDLLFFAGDQSYHHTEHTYGWLEFGIQFRDVLKDRPVITIPDDHDVGQANIWGENGKQATNAAGPSGGYFYPPRYVNMVQRCQTWHLPDPYDPRPIERGIGVYYTDLTVGGINFAIIEDRKFKSGPEGKIPKMGPRPDHINDPKYDRAAVDLPGLKLLGERQLKFLHAWSQDWTGAEMKCVLSQTAFCGAVHLHGSKDNRLLADLDSNAWPQTGRNRALREIRRAWAPHMCGDQHLAVVVKHGIDEARDGPYGFTSPAIVNTIYGRWWWPEDERAGPNPVPDSPLPWTGDYLDGLGNKIHMMAYANPPNTRDEKQRGDGFGISRFHKKTRQVTFECWPRFADVADGDAAQYPGWPMTIEYRDNDGRTPVGFLPELAVAGTERPVVQVVQATTGEILYTVRAPSNRFKPPVYAAGQYDVRIGKDKPNLNTLKGLTPVEEGQDLVLHVEL